ncbi:MAG: polysaccharide biosynthesis tyrosine autokinase [Crocinitomicaceae bacterium]|nr:polysaccharide biosynthesis tyrosine autokinase [Crocinitomicaceae bacterium]
MNVRAKVFLDTLSDVFIDFSKRTQLEVNQNTLDNIEKQILEVQKIITTIENQLLRYKDDNDILNLTKEEEEYFSKYVDYGKQKREVDLSLNSLILLEDYILTSPDEHILAPSFYILNDEPVLDKRVQEMYEKQISIVDLIYNYSDVHPTVIKAREEIGAMKKDLLIYIKNLKMVLEEKTLELDKMIGTYKGEIQEMPRSIQGVDNIRRELDVNNKMYLFFIGKKANTLIARAGIIPQVQVIEKPSSLGVVGPDKARINRLFLLSGIVIAFFIAFIRRLFFERVQNVNELASISNIDIIGGIPLLQKIESEIVIDQLPKAQITESFRTIRSNIAYYGKEGIAKKIVISSFLPSEGKTFCSGNLALILAKSDKRVLLVDFDMHKPKIHKAFGIDNKIGVSNFLSGKAELGAVITHAVYDNLDVITTGPVPPNPSELIMRKQVSDLFNWAEANYDYILIDTPPFGLLNDAIVMLEKADLFIVVMNTKFANRRGVAEVEKFLANILMSVKHLF